MGVSGFGCKAIIHPETGFTIDSVIWRLYNNQVTEPAHEHNNKVKILSGSGNPYLFAIPGGYYGNKVVRCYVGYHNTRTGDVGMAVRDKYFKVWFVQGFDDNQNGIPNWYENWKKDRAVPDMDKTVYEVWTGQANCMCYGEVKNNIAYLTQYDNGQMFDIPLVLHTYFGTESFGGPTVTGIDCSAFVTAHELYHVWVNNQWEPGGVFYGKTDTDFMLQAPDCNDMLPDWYETGWSHTSIKDTDTYDLEHLQQSSYRTYGDQEYMAHRAGNRAKGIVSNDWGYPGKQSIPPIVSMSSLNYNGSSDGYFTGNYSDHGRDVDGDGLYDFLTITAEINVTSGGLFYPGFQLCDSAGNMITFVDNASVLEMGRQYISRDFDGLKIRSYGVDGPYNITSFLANSYGEIIDRHQNIYRSGSYSSSDFEKQDAVFTGDFSDNGSDVNSNSLYDYLRVDVGVNIETTGEYTVSGWLCNGSENAIAYANTTVFFNAGPNTLSLRFNGTDISYHMINGPYSVKYLYLSKGKTVDFLYDAYTTKDYNYTEFEMISNAPDKPLRPNGETSAVLGQEYVFNTSSVDVDGDNLYYQWDWGDNNFSEWLGPYISGESAESYHIWNNVGNYSVRVIAMDSNGVTSDWSDPLQVEITKSGGSSPSVYLLYPQGGETLKDSVKITWTAYDSEDGNNLPIYFYYSSDNGRTWSPFTSNPQENTGGYSWDTTKLPDGVYLLQISAMDSDNNIGFDTSGQFQIKNHEAPSGNHEPLKPNQPSGPTNGNIKQEYSYTTSTTDPDGDQVFYFWDWGDGNNSGWLGPFDSGVTAGATYNWTGKGSFSIKVKAKDIYGHESVWSDPLPITMPYSHKPMRQFLEWLFERFPHAFPILRQIFG